MYPHIAEDCADARQNVNAHVERHAELEQEQIKWLAQHCKPVNHRSVSTDMSGNITREGPSSDTSQYYVCNGQLINSLPATPAMRAERRTINTLNRFLQQCCDRPPLPDHECSNRQ